MFVSVLLDVIFKSNIFFFLVPQETKISRIEGKQVAIMRPTLLRFPLKIMC